MSLVGECIAARNEARGWRKIRLAVLLMPIVAACDATDLLIPRGSLTIEPASTTVTLQPNGGFLIPVTISNSSESTVYLSDGCEWSVEQSRLMGDEGPREWVRVLNPPCLLVLSPPVAIDPGQALVVTIDTRGSELGASNVFDGQYRVRFLLSVKRGRSFYQLPDEQSVSTPFTVVAS